MSLAVIIAPAILDTVLGRLAMLFLSGAGGDLAIARQAACQMLDAYRVANEAELGLAADIVSFRLHALEALSQAVDPDLPLNTIIRLRSAAVSLNREAHRSQRKLDQLQRDRQSVAVQPPVETTTTPDVSPGRPDIDNAPLDKASADKASRDKAGLDKALGLIEFARDALQAAGNSRGPTWTQSYQKRQTAKRLAEKLRKSQARQGQAANQPPVTTAAAMTTAILVPA